MRDAQPADLQIEVDLRNNSLAIYVSEFEVTGEADFGSDVEGILDIGTRGQLIGVEIGHQYLAISDPIPGAGHLTRSVNVLLTLDRDGDMAKVSIRRLGGNYEISFPSGNQCWQVGRGRSVGSGNICSVVIT